MSEPTTDVGEWGRAASAIADAAGVTAWFGFNEQEAAINRALANKPNDEGVIAAAHVLRTWTLRSHL